MNAILSYLHDNRKRLQLERYGVHGDLSFMLLTPHFRASSHVIFLIFDQGKSTPALVAKVPRQANTFARLEREATNLQMLQSMRPRGFASVPALVAFEPFHNRAILVETALVGQSMDSATVRREHNYCCLAVANWLCELQWPPSMSQRTGADRFQRLVEMPYSYFAERVPLSREEEGLLEQTWALLARLHETALPTVFEHGDLSHPNLFLLESGEPGIVDWETAEPYGLPACDLFFFLTYVALSKCKARSAGQALVAFQSAFFGDQAWARHYIGIYARRLQLPDRALTPLFVLCWLRYLVSLLTRIDQDAESAAPMQSDTAIWLRNNRFYAFWREAVTRAEELEWWGGHPSPLSATPSRIMVAK